MPISRATARSDSPAAPTSASCRRAAAVISAVSSARARSRAVGAMPPNLHVIVGKGPVGTTTADLLAAHGHRVRVLSRSGGTSTDAIEHRRVDAADAGALAAAAHGAAALYNAVNPAYHRWATDWPPVAAALLTAAERTGAVLVTMSNLYVYGSPTGPMGPDSPLAATDLKGRVRIAEW